MKNEEKEISAEVKNEEVTINLGEALNMGFRITVSDGLNQVDVTDAIVEKLKKLDKGENKRFKSGRCN